MTARGAAALELRRFDPFAEVSELPVLCDWCRRVAYCDVYREDDWPCAVIHSCADCIAKRGPQ